MTFQRLATRFTLFFIAITLFSCVNSNDTANDPRLRLISLSEGELQPPYSQNIEAYQVEVNENTPNIAITAFARNLDSSILINNRSVEDSVPSSPIALLLGKNVIKIDVVAKDGNSRSSYQIDVYRGVAAPEIDGDSNGGNGDPTPTTGAELGSLRLLDVPLDQAFQARQFDYTATSGSLIDAIRVLATTDTENQLFINGQLTISGEPSLPIPLNEGINQIEIIVITPNNTETKIYTIELTKEPFNGFTHSPALRSGNPERGSQFGFSAAMSNETIAIGAPDETNGRGAVYLYQLNNNRWELTQQLILTNSASGDRFGQSLSMQDDQLAIGAMKRSSGTTPNTGEVYLYQRSGNIWSETTKLTAPSPQAGHRFGYNVVLSGDRLAVATLRGRDEQADSGQVFVFKQTGADWTLEDTVGDAGFGSSDKYAASIDMDGDLLAIGSFSQPNCQVNGDGDAGSVRLYKRNNVGQWNQIQQLDGEGPVDRFGFSIDIQGNRLAIGAQCEDEHHTNLTEGAVYIYEKTGSTFNLQQKIKAFQTAQFSLYGDRVSLSDDKLIVTGSFEIPHHNFNSSLVAAGAAYLVERTNGHWQETKLFQPIPLDNNDRFGISLSTDSGRAVIGAPGGEINSDDPNNAEKTKIGAAYVFD